MVRVEDSQRREEEARQRYMGCNHKVAAENLYQELESNGPKIIHRLAKTRHRRCKDMQWYGHVQRRNSEEDIRKLCEMAQEGSRPRGHPKQRWSDTINVDLRWLDLDGNDAEDRVRWRSLIELGVKQKPARRTGQRQ